MRGNSAAFVCIANGTPTPVMSWLKDGQTLLPGPHLVLLNLNTTVQITYPRVNDTGRYTCVANNTAGQASRHFNLKVLGEFKMRMKNISAHTAEVNVLLNLFIQQIRHTSKALVSKLRCLWWLIMS